MPPTSDSTHDSKRIAFLRQTPLFAALGEKDLLALSSDLKPSDYARNEIIFRQGDAGSSLFVILKGKVRIFETRPSGDETSITIYGAGDLIGEFAVLDDGPRSAAALAIEPCTLLQISRDRFLFHLHEVPELGLQLARLLVAKLRWTTEFALTIAQYDAAGRLLHFLLLFNERFGEEQAAGKRYLLDLGLNQTDLASLVGVRREWVNHLLRDWQRRGLIEHRDGKLFILDLPRVIGERDSRLEALTAKEDW
jgi:CRP/FNR family cyclic AMP-dependent transcriptional regulator